VPPFRDGVSECQTSRKRFIMTDTGGILRNGFVTSAGEKEGSSGLSARRWHFNRIPTSQTSTLAPTKGVAPFRLCRHSDPMKRRARAETTATAEGAKRTLFTKSMKTTTYGIAPRCARLTRMSHKIACFKERFYSVRILDRFQQSTLRITAVLTKTGEKAFFTPRSLPQTPAFAKVPAFSRHYIVVPG
jgi:hypothetical protein